MPAVRRILDKYDGMYLVEYFFGLFILASFVGWVAELICFRIADGEWVNRGILMGPWLPIYGMGAMIALLLSSQLKDRPALLFVISAITCTVVEYSIAMTLENMWGVRLWDYSDNVANYQGKVSLVSSLGFAGGCMCLVYIVEPVYRKIVVEKLPRHIYETICSVLLVVFTADLLYSFVGQFFDIL